MIYIDGVPILDGPMAFKLSQIKQMNDYELLENKDAIEYAKANGLIIDDRATTV